jgi:hypothetical protein
MRPGRSRPPGPPVSLRRFRPPSGKLRYRLPVTDALDSTLTLRLREVLASGDTTEADLRELMDESSALVRELRAQLRAGERRLRALNADPGSPIVEIADELRRVETIRPRLREARELSRRLDERARELRTAWLFRQAEARRATG